MKKKNVVKFGNYLLSEKRKESYEAISKELAKEGFYIESPEERLKSVSDADLSNYKG